MNLDCRLISSKFLRLLLGIGATMLFLSACGVKTAPYPASATLPGPVNGLTQSISADGEMIISWLAPENNMVGRPLKSLSGFQIELSDNIAANSYCVSCPHRYSVVDKVPVMSPPPGQTLASGPYQWRHKIVPGHVYKVRVTGMSSSGGLHPEARVETTVWGLEPPGTISGFTALLGDKAVDIRWKAPPAGYGVEVEKVSPGGGRALVPDINPKSGRYLDLNVDYEQGYIYRARLTRTKAASSTPGEWSREIAVHVYDYVPPNPPGYLDGALMPDGVKLSWESLVNDPQVAYYRVYRKLSDETQFKRIAQTPQNTYFDRVNLDGVDARYQVTAVDKSPRANESKPSPAADVLLEPIVDEVPRP